jgi:hypothetical protein
LSKREQISRLLITKFRNKFQISLQQEADLDAKICDQVNSVVKTDEALGEKQLIILSRKIQ